MRTLNVAFKSGHCWQGGGVAYLVGVKVLLLTSNSDVKKDIRCEKAFYTCVYSLRNFTNKKCFHS